MSRGKVKTPNMKRLNSGLGSDSEDCEVQAEEKKEALGSSEKKRRKHQISKTVKKLLHRHKSDPTEHYVQKLRCAE